MLPSGQIKKRKIGSILIVDDHPLYCDALATTLQQMFETDDLKTASCLVDALAIVRGGFCPDLVMLDLNLPDVQGLGGFVQVRDQMQDTSVVVFSAEASDELIANIMAMGGSGFISKNASRDDLADALSKVIDGQSCFPNGITRQRKPVKPDPDAMDVARRLAELSPQQARILRLICEGKPNKQIAYEMSLAEATVKAHVTALLRRLGVRNRTQAALMVQGLNFDQRPGNDSFAGMR